MWIKVFLVVSIAFFAVQAGPSTQNPNPRKPPNVRYVDAGAIPRTKPAGKRPAAVIDWLEDNHQNVAGAIAKYLGVDPDPTSTLFQAGGYRIDLQSVEVRNNVVVKQRFALQQGSKVLGQVHLENVPDVVTSLQRKQLGNKKDKNGNVTGGPRTVGLWLTNGLFKSLRNGHIFHVIHVPNPFQPSTTPTPQRG